MKGLKRLSATGPKMIPTMVATAEEVSIVRCERLTCFANVKLLFDEQAHQRKDANISSQNAISQMDGADLRS